MNLMTNKKHKEAMQLFIDLYEEGNRLKVKNTYRIIDTKTERSYWIANGPSFFRIETTKSGMDVSNFTYRIFWWLSPTHHKAWKCAKILIDRGIEL